MPSDATSLTIIMVLLLVFAVATIIVSFILIRRRAAKRAAQGITPANRRVTLKQLDALPASEGFARMHRELRGWGMSLIVIGGLSLVVSGFNSQWGVVLVIVGAMSFIFKDASMFAVYGVVLAWAGISNLISASG